MVVRIPLAVEKALEMMHIFKIRSFRQKNTVESVGSADESRDKYLANRHLDQPI